MSSPTYSNLHEKLGDGSISFTVGTTIKKDVQTLWDHVCKADLVKKYFTTDAKGDLDKGGEVLWIWGDEGALINILEVYPNEKIVFEWNAYKAEYRVTAEFIFEDMKSYTRLKIKERGWHNDDIGVKSALANNGGWTEFVNALKIYLEHNIAFLKS